MDIVSRIKKFMNSQHVASSQFADNCGIPRPTISQILNGRNKKISDELISKIHNAYPELSVLWLMFGEGSMTTNANIEISEAQKDLIPLFDNEQTPDHELFSGGKIDFNDVDKIQSEKNFDMFDGFSRHNKGENNSDAISDQTLRANEISEIDKKQNSERISQIISNSTSQYKKITSIVVFYDDSTFQTFTPS